MHGVRLADPTSPLRIGKVGVVTWVVAVATFVWATGPTLALSAGPRANGTVVAIQRSGRSGKPVVEFETRQGVRRRITGVGSASPPAYSVGERVGVYYDPDDPSRAVIDSFGELWLVPLIHIATGLASLAAAAGGLGVGYARRRRREAVRSNGRRLRAIVTEVDEVRDKKHYRYLSTLTVEATEPAETLVVDFGFRPRVGDHATVFVDPVTGEHFVEAGG